MKNLLWKRTRARKVRRKVILVIQNYEIDFNIKLFNLDPQKFEGLMFKSQRNCCSLDNLYRKKKQQQLHQDIFHFFSYQERFSTLSQLIDFSTF